jgi:putative ABC transport system permease protein
MKFLRYILRNIRRNPVRSFLTIASVAISLFLVMILVTFFAMNREVAAKNRVHNRIIVMNSQGFTGRVPITMVREVASMDGVIAATPFSWFGGKYAEETIPFAQFGVDASKVLTVYEELKVPAAQVVAWQQDKAGCLVGRKLAEDRGLKLGDPLPLKGDIYPVDLKLTIRAIYDGTAQTDRRMCMFHWDYLDEALRRDRPDQDVGNASMVVAKCKSPDGMATICRKIDDSSRNSDTPTRTQSEEAFALMFDDMMGDLKGIMQAIGLAVCFALIFVSGNAMAMALRERTTEIAVLKAIGYGSQLILFLVLTEAMLVSAAGGILGAVGCKVLCDYVDVAKFSAGMLPFFYVSWPTALMGLGASALIGFLSGFVPAVIASRRSVVAGLRKVV